MKSMRASGRSRTLLWGLGSGAAYFLAARAGTLFVADGLTAIWLASGVLLAALLGSDSRNWRAVGVFTLAAAAASVMVDGNPTPATAVAAAAGWAEGLLAAVLLTRALGGRPSLARLRDVAALIAAAALACAAGAIAGAAALSSEAGNPLGSTWITWWTSDTVGMLAVAPVAVALRDAAGQRPTKRAVGESVLLLAAVIAVALLVFGADPSVGGLRSALPAALALPLLVAASVRFGAVPTSLGGLALSLIAARLTVEDHGPFANAVASTADRLLGMRTFLAVALGISLAAVALAAERRRAVRDTRNQSERLRHAESQRDTEQRRVQELIGTAFDAVITIDEDGLVTDWNPAAQRTFGWSRTEAVGRPLTATILPANLRLPYEATLELLRRAGEVSGIGERIELEACRRDGREAPVELTLSSIRGEDGLSFHLVANDLSEMRALEEQRASAEALIKAAEAQVAKSEEDRRRIAEEVRRARLQATRAELLERAAAAEYERRLEDGEHERLRLERSFDDAPIGMALADPGGRLSRVNTALSELTGLPRERLETITVEELARSGDREL